MDYKKAYEDALERAKGIYNDNQSSSTAKFVCGQIFPELYESEDERIRKWISDRLLANYSKEDDMVKEALVWLEKQKEQVMDETNKIAAAYQLGRSDERKQKKQKPISFNEPYNPDDYEVVMEGDATGLRRKEQKHHYSPLCNTIKDKIREYIANHFIADRVVKTDMKSIVKAMEEGVRLGMEEQQPAEWSDEDERLIDEVITLIEDGALDKEEKTYYIERLKSLRPQPHTVSIKNANKFAELEYERGVKDGLNHHWKPSEEQMDALLKLEEMFVLEHEKNQETARLYVVIKSLKEQLLKLRREEL